MARREEIRFHPIDLKKSVAIGVKLPFSGKDGKVFAQSYTTEEQAISNLKSLLLTRKGERFMQPGLGSRIYDTLFEQNTEDLVDELSTGLKRDISYWLPYINVRDLIVSREAEGMPAQSREHGIYINLKFTVGTSNANQEITFLVTNRNITLI